MRVGAAKTPGPTTPARRLRGKQRPASCPPSPESSTDSPVTSTDSACDPALPPASESPPQTASPDATALRAMLQIKVKRANGKAGALNCSLIHSKRTFRWQMRGQPPLNGTERRTAHASLRGFMDTHAAELAEESLHDLEERYQELEEYASSLPTLFKKPAARVRVPAQDGLPAAPPKTIIAQASRPLTWPQLLQIQELPVSTLRWPPRACRASLQMLIARLLASQESSPEQPALADYLFVLPKLLWPHHPASSSEAPAQPRTRAIAHRIQCAMEGDWQQLYEDLCQIAPPPPAPAPTAADTSDPIPEDCARGLYKQASRGHGAEAWRRMNGHGMAPATPSNVSKAFEKLAPAADDPILEIPQPAQWRPAKEQLLAALPRLRDGKGHDAGGWSHEAVVSHLNSSACRLPFAQWLADMSASACQYRKQLWSATRLVMLNKPAANAGEPGIRPILMSMTFRKIVSMAAHGCNRPDP